MSEFAARSDRHENQRAAAFATLLAVDPDQGVPLVGRVLAECGRAGRSSASRAAQALGTRRHAAPRMRNCSTRLEKAPARLQTVIAAALAGKPEGAEQLLGRSRPGKASARVLQDRAVQTRLNESKLPKAAERVAELTKGLPTADQKFLELMNQRREGFAKAKADAKLGRGGVTRRTAPTAISSAARGPRSARSSMASAPAGSTGCSRTSSTRRGTSIRRCGRRC